MDAEDHFGALASVWDAQAEAMNAAMGAHADAARRALAAASGENIADLGCGPGLSAVALGAEVGPTGWIAAIDIVPQMAQAAGRRMATAGVPGTSAAADVATADLPSFGAEGRPFDAVHSRFGLMFFPQPGPAFANIASAMRPGARLAASVWQPIDRNPWMALTTVTAMGVLGITPQPSHPGGPGPFSLGDPDSTARLFSEAGFADVRFDAIEAPFVFEGDGFAAAERILGAGPVGGAFLAADANRRREVVEAVVGALADHRSAQGYAVPAASWCITAWRG